MSNKTFESEYGKIVKEFKADPRNKIHVNLTLLTLSANVETGDAHKESKINKIIGKYTEGGLDDDETTIYDGAVAVCGALARECLGGDPDAETDYEITWLQDDSAYFAEVRQN